MLVFRRRSLALVAVLLASILVFSAVGLAPAFAGPTVTVRVEGESSTLLPQTTVTLNTPEPVSGCPANSVAAAINLAVKGNWDHGEAIAGGDFTKTVLGETHAFANKSDTWAEWVNYKWGGGICSDLLGNHDEVVMIADHEPEPFYAPTVWPLVVTNAPASVQVGTPFTVQVSEIRTPAGTFPELGQGAPATVAGATLSGAGATAAPSAANGIATVTLTSAGSIALRATKAGDAPSASFVVCAHQGNDGTCGTQAPSPTPSGSSQGQTSAGGGVSGFSTNSLYKGPYAVVARATRLIDGHVYSRRHAPRVLTGSVLAHTTLSSVSIRLRRSYRGHCHAYDGIRERFVAARCGHGSFFKVSTEPRFSYLLPSALPVGRYVLDIAATDAAGNHTRLARGTSRIVFYVG